MEETTQLCRRCRFHPTSSRSTVPPGYCSWDCYDYDDEGARQPEPASA